MHLMIHIKISYIGIWLSSPAIRNSQFELYFFNFCRNLTVQCVGPIIGTTEIMFYGKLQRWMIKPLCSRAWRIIHKMGYR